MTIAPFQSNSSLPETEKSRPFVQLNMMDDRESQANNGNNYHMHFSWDTYNVANRRPLTTHKPKFYKQLYYPESDAETNHSLGKAILSFLTSASRWAVIIFGVLALLWLPAILQFTLFKHGEIWGVALLQWSIWLTVFWGSWWAATVVSRLLPYSLQVSVGKVVPQSWTYIDFIPSLSRYNTLFLWSLASWVSLQPLVVNKINPNASSRSKSAVMFIAKLFFGLFLCTVLLLGEKIAIQFIAKHFHEQSYADRIDEQKGNVEVLIILYSHSTNIPVPPLPFMAQNTEGRNTHNSTSPSIKPTATILRQVAKNLLGISIILPDSPECDVLTALCSANETRLLARRIYYSFVRPGETALVPADILRCFSTAEQANRAFGYFDRDGNGDVTADEVELACMECHNEQLSLANSLKDLDSAVGRLDNILMTIYTFIAILIIAVVLDSQLSTLLIGTGTFILGLSWLIGGSLTEVLTSIIFLFVKHPYDVGDKIIIDGIQYTVREIFLLSTILLDNNNTAMQAPHVSLAPKIISNIRRSPLMCETFSFDVDFSTKLDQLGVLRDKMLEFVKSHNRDYLPAFDITVVDIPGQAKMTLTADIKYKGNWQHGTLKTQRRNKWICALKECLAEIKIYGPASAGDPSPTLPTMYTEVPWSEAQEMAKKAHSSLPTTVPGKPADDNTPGSVGQNKLLNRNAGIFDSSQNAFGESEDLAMSNPILRTLKPPDSVKIDESKESRP